MGDIETAIHIQNQHATLGVLRAHRDSLLAQRDELLAALEWAQALFLHGVPSHAPGYAAAMSRIDAAIANAKGGAE